MLNAHICEYVKYFDILLVEFAIFRNLLIDHFMPERTFNRKYV
jgi:hypothetical protein